jgi:simple sugar transport system substrate-binding protein
MEFVDRDDELSEIDLLINAWNTSRVLCLQGPGGIGKTRLLQEVHEKYTLAPTISTLESRALETGDFVERSATIALISWFGPSQLLDQLQGGVESMCTELGVKSIVRLCDFDNDKMVQALDEVIAEKPDAIILARGFGKAVEEGVARAIARGIKVITVAGSLDIDGISTNVDVNNYELALRLLTRMVEDINAQGDIAVITMAAHGDSPQTQRRSVLDFILRQYPKINLVADLVVEHGSTEKIVQDTEEKLAPLLKQHPNLRAVWTSWYPPAIGACELLMESGRTDTYVYGIDLVPEVMELMLKPDSPWRATATLDYFELGRLRARLALQAIYEEPLKQHYSPPVALVDQDSLRLVPDGEPLSSDYVDGWGESFVGWRPWMHSLREKHSTLKYPRRLAVLDIIDFDNAELRNAHSLYLKTAELLSTSLFSPYIEALEDWRLTEKAKVSQERLDKETQILNEAFAACFNSISEHRRVVMFWDTTDMLDEQTVEDLGAVIPSLRNFALLVCGRNASVIYEKLLHRMADEVRLTELQPLSLSASQSYLESKQKQLLITMEPRLVNKLAVLSDGHPILLDLAADWLARDVPLPWIEEATVPELEALAESELSQRKEELGRYLVNRIGQMRYQMDRVMLTMSYIYPLDSNMLADVLADVSLSQAERLLADAAKYAAIKSLPNGQMKLHDEVQRLVEEYVWPEVDADGHRRQHLSRRFAAILGARLDKIGELVQENRDRSSVIEHQLTELDHSLRETHDLDQGQRLVMRTDTLRAERLRVFQQNETLENERWTLAEHLLQHTMLVGNPKETVQAFTNLFDEAWRIYRLSSLDALLKQVLEIADTLEPVHRFSVRIRQARYMYDLGMYAEAEALLGGLKSGQLTHEQQVDVLQLLSNTRIRLGNFKSGIEDLEEAVCISADKNLEARLAQAQTSLGWGYRLTGRLEDAMRLYRQAWRWALDVDDKLLQVKLLRNMAYIYALKRNHQTAYELCHEALSLSKSLQNSREIRKTYSTFASILLEAGNLEAAYSYRQRALSDLDTEKNIEDLSDRLSTGGLIHWLMGDLTSAQEDLEHALALDLRKNEPRILHGLANIHLDSGNVGKAEEILLQGYEASKAIFDPRHELYCLGGLAKVSIMKREFQKWQTIDSQFHEYQARWPEVQFWVPEGLLHKYLGDLMAGDGKLEPAIDSYKRGLPLLHQYSNYRPFTVPVQLRFTESIFQGIGSYEPLRHLGRALADFWVDENLDVENPTVLSILSSWKRLRA